MATHSSILAWRTPCTEEPGGPRSVGSQSHTPLKRLSIHSHIPYTYRDIYIYIYICPSLCFAKRHLGSCIACASVLHV